jgi:hypothetical protein
MRRRIDPIRAGDGRLRLTDRLLLVGLLIMCVMVLVDFAERDDPEPALMLGLAVVLVAYFAVVAVRIAVLLRGRTDRRRRR